MKLRIKKGDMVRVIAGNYKSDDKAHRVLQVYPKQMRILVEGVNIRKKHSKPNQKNQQGGIISMEMPIHYSNVLLDDGDKLPTRVGIKFDDKTGKRIPLRYAKTNNKVI